MKDSPKWENLLYRMLRVGLLLGCVATLRAARECSRNSYEFEIYKEFYTRAKEEMLAVPESKQITLSKFTG